MINAFSSRNLLFSPTISLCLLTLLHCAITGIRVLIPFDGTLYHYTSFHVVIDKKIQPTSSMLDINFDWEGVQEGRDGGIASASIYSRVGWLIQD